LAGFLGEGGTRNGLSGGEREKGVGCDESELISKTLPSTWKEELPEGAVCSGGTRSGCERTPLPTKGGFPSREKKTPRRGHWKALSKRGRGKVLSFFLKKCTNAA